MQDHFSTSEAALQLGDQGLHVFPVFGVGAGGKCACDKASCRNNAGKHPINRTGLKGATTEPGIIRHFWQATPGANIGVVTGEPSGILVLDVDGAAGRKSLNGYELPPTLTVSTGRSDGGKHHWYRYPGSPIKNFVNLLPSVDVRGDGGYVIVPPSRHRSGNEYQWGNAEGFNWEAVKDAPEWLFQLIEKKLRERGPQLGSSPSIASGARNDTIFRECAKLRATGANLDTIYAYAKARNAQCQEPLDDSELQTIAQSAARYEPTPELQHYRHTDEGNAHRLVLLHGDEIRYSHEQKAWLFWDSKRWREDRWGRVKRLAASTVEETFNLAVKKGDKTLESWTAATEKHHGIRRMIEATQSREGISVTTEDLDRFPMLLNVQNGTINLENGHVLPHNPKYLLTKMAPVDFDRLATAPRWLAFLTEVFGGDEELIRFVQKAIGYSLTGDLREQVFFICYGSGENGKSTFLNAVRELLGDYAQNTPFNSFEADNRNQLGNDIAALRGSRFVTAIESEQDKRLAEARVKAVTGGDPLTCRFLYGNFFTYQPEWKVWLAVNHKPEIRGVERAIWRRIHLIPFTQSFEGLRGDKALPGKLKAEAPGILNWMLEGLRLWHKEGLGPIPQIVQRAIQEYRAEMDTLGEWINEKATVSKDATERVSMLFADYRDWSESRGERPMTLSRFSRQLVERGFERSHIKKGSQFRGIGLDPLRMNSNRAN